MWTRIIMPKEGYKSMKKLHLPARHLVELLQWGTSPLQGTLPTQENTQRCSRTFMLLLGFKL